MDTDNSGMVDIAINNNPSVKKEMPVKSIVRPGYFEVIVIVLIIVCGGLWIYDNYFATKITVVDFQEFVKSQKELIKANAITEAEWRANLERFDSIMKSLPENQLVITKDVVLKNGNSNEIPIK
ncbi:MAG: hypothetical protein PHI97_12470 [Desulfobulbus sp.]|nr:hypothetical protein [Desulfobulbus sp.]